MYKLPHASDSEQENIRDTVHDSAKENSRIKSHCTTIHANTTPGPNLTQYIYGWNQLTELLQLLLKNERLPQDFNDANIIHLYKNKGDKATRDNRRGISHLTIAGKIKARVAL